MLNYLRSNDGKLLDSDTFDLGEFIKDIPETMLESPRGRKALTRYNPLLFLLIYLPHMMRSEETGNVLSVNDMNLLFSAHALEWLAPKTIPKRQGLRRAYLAPRGSSKSSTLKGCVLWALAHTHLRYILMFSGSDVQAEKALASLKKEFDNNELLRTDYPYLCTPGRRKATKVSLGDGKNVYKSESAITVESRSITSSVLGAKEGDLRPQLIVCDDVSRGEGTGSVYQSRQRLEVLIGTVLPLNTNAPVAYLCTNHFIGSIEDNLLKSLSSDSEEHEPWVAEENFEVFWLKPIVERSDGTLRSIWPERWTLEFLLSERHKRSYKKDMENLPVPLGSGEWFDESDFIIEQIPSVSKYVLSIDPGISEKGDATGISVLGFSFAVKKAVVYEAFPLRLKATELKKRVFDLISAYPDISDVVYEATQGGEALFYATYGYDFSTVTGIKVHFIHPNKSKLERAEILLTRYRKRQIVHDKKLPAYSAECMTLPFYSHSPNMVDSVGQGVEFLATAGHTSNKLQARQRSLR